MADLAQVKQMMNEEDLVLHRGLMLLGSMLAGMTVTYFILSRFFPGGLPSFNVVGYLTMGLKTPGEVYRALAIVAGGVAGVLLGQWGWMMMAQWQRVLGVMPAAVALKRSTVIFAPFLAYITMLSTNQGLMIAPLAAGLLLLLGFSLLAILEKKDKRKIYFAFPTENRYQPASLFTHGSIIVLGAGVGWFLQALTGPGLFSSLGLWFSLGVGLAVWIVIMLLAGLLALFFSKLTFDQVYVGLAFVAMPLAILPLQTLGGLTYTAYGKVVAVTKVAWLMPTLVGVASLAAVVILALVLLSLRKKKVEMVPAWEEVFRALMLIIPIPLLLYAVAYWPMGAAFSGHHLLGPLALFREGEPLGAAQAILMGRLPFKDILFRHGFIADALSGLAAVNWFGGTLEAYRLMLSYLAPLGLIAIYVFAIFCMPWLWALLLALTMLTGALGMIPYTRFLFPLIGFIFTLFYLQSNRWLLLIFSGLMTALSVIASYTAGIMALAGQLTLVVVFVVVDREPLKKRLTGLAVYLGATLAGLLPWFLYLAMSGSLGAYFDNFAWVMNNYGAVFGLPMPGLGDHPSLMQWLIFALPPAMIAIGALQSLKAIFAGKQHGTIPWNILLLTVITTLYWVRFLDRSDYTFLLETLPIAAMLAAFYLFRLTIRQARLKGLVMTALLPLLLIPQAGRIDLKTLAEGFGQKTVITVDGLVKPKSLLLGNVFLQPNQAREIDELVSYMNEQVGSAESFFDFSNQPLLYFLVPRRPVTRALATVSIATFEQQLAAIRALNLNEVKMVVADGRPLGEAGLDGLPCEVRQYALSEYLLKKYVPIKKIGQTVIMLPRDGELNPEPQAVQAMKRMVSLAYMPLTMGQEAKYASGQGNGVDQYIVKDKSDVDAHGLTVTASAQGVEVADGVGQVSLVMNAKANKAADGNVLRLTLRASPRLQGRTAKLLWGKASDHDGLQFLLKGSGQEETYVFRVGSLPAWVWAGSLKQLTLVMPAGGWQWKSLQVLAVKDIPELSQAPAAKSEAGKPGQK